MSVYRYFKLDGVQSGEWPDSHPVRVGEIIRIDIMGGGTLPNSVWNSATSDWVHPVWVEVPDPRGATTGAVK